MQHVTATQAKNVLGQVLQDAATHIVIIENRGKPTIAAMPEADAVVGTLCAYATGHIPRSRAMQMLGFTWYGELKDALQAAGVTMTVDPVQHRHMVDTAVSLLRGKA
jgi:hypothetical protein